MTRPGQPLPGAVSGGVGDGVRGGGELELGERIREEEVEDVHDQGRMRMAEKQVTLSRLGTEKAKQERRCDTQDPQWPTL